MLENTNLSASEDIFSAKNVSLVNNSWQYGKPSIKDKFIFKNEMNLSSKVQGTALLHTSDSVPELVFIVNAVENGPKADQDLKSTLSIN